LRIQPEILRPLQGVSVLFNYYIFLNNGKLGSKSNTEWWGGGLTSPDPSVLWGDDAAIKQWSFLPYFISQYFIVFSSHFLWLFLKVNETVTVINSSYFVYCSAFS
jgi:hypothetical protein